MSGTEDLRRKLSATKARPRSSNARATGLKSMGSEAHVSIWRPGARVVFLMTVSGGGAVGAGLGLSPEGGAVSARVVRVGKVESRATRRKCFIG